jgi:hypothetical protein
MLGVNLTRTDFSYFFRLYIFLHKIYSSQRNCYLNSRQNVPNVIHWTQIFFKQEENAVNSSLQKSHHNKRNNLGLF